MPHTKRTFLHDAVDFVALGSHSLKQDDFSDCFKPVSPFSLYKGRPFYALSFFIRYFILFPLRLFIFVVCSSLITAVFLYGRYLRKYAIVEDCFIVFNKFMMLLLNFHVVHKGEKRMHPEPHLYVSNHTSFIDYLVLSSHKFIHACIAEGHAGLFGFILTNVLSLNGTIGFRRSDRQDKSQILAKVRQHIYNMKSPMLIFPEGTCVNNESIVLFQKGAFELGIPVCPVGIRYRKNQIDPYWNRREHGFTMHLFYLFTRWGMDAEVHWMPPMVREEGEDAVMFSHRVKNAIAKEMGLRNTIWNGYFKSSPVMNDREIMKECFVRVYLDIKNGELEKKRQLDIEAGRLYLPDEGITDVSSSGKSYFGGISYKSFINECCKEYLRVKATRSAAKLVSK